METVSSDDENSIYLMNCEDICEATLNTESTIIGSNDMVSQNVTLKSTADLEKMQMKDSSINSHNHDRESVHVNCKDASPVTNGTSFKLIPFKAMKEELLGTMSLAVFPDGFVRLAQSSVSAVESGETTGSAPNEDKPLDDKGTKIWTYDETLALISTYEKFQTELSHPVKRRKAWARITGELLSLAIKVTEMQVINKWRSLVKTYKVIRDNKRKTGRGAVKFQHYDALHELLSHRPTNGYIHQQSETPSFSEPSTSAAPLTSPAAPRPQRSRKLSDVLRDYFVRKEEREQHKLEARGLREERRRRRRELRERQRSERHNEKMQLKRMKMGLLEKLLKPRK